MKLVNDKISDAVLYEAYLASLNRLTGRIWCDIKKQVTDIFCYQIRNFVTNQIEEAK